MVSVTNVMAVSLDGYIASYPGESDADRRRLGFTNEADRQYIRELVKQSDAVVVGAESMRVSRRSLADANDKGVVPTWIVPTRSGIDASLPWWQQTEVPKCIVAPDRAEIFVGENAERIGSDKDGVVATIMKYLERKQLTRIVLFGGAEINRLFYAEGLVDLLKLTICPIILGQKEGVPLVVPNLPSAVHLDLITSHSEGNLVFLSYSVKRA